MFINPFLPFSFLKITTLKGTITILIILLIKTNLLRLKGGLIGGLLALSLLSGLLVTSSIAFGSIIYSLKLRDKLNSKDFEGNNVETINI